MREGGSGGWLFEKQRCILCVKMNRLCINPHWDETSVGSVECGHEVLDEDMKQPSCSLLQHLTFTIQTAQGVGESATAA